jgi:3-dehydroquinate synthase class II
VDIRGSIIRSSYNQGQVMLEVEGTSSQNSRYQRAYVLVLPTTQIVGREGTSISLSELQQGQNVAVLLRSGGRGNLEGIGIARMIWVEEVY